MEHDLPDGDSIKPYTALAGHLRLAVRLTPNGGRDGIDGIERQAEGHVFLKARVTAVPENGRANKALIALLAKRLGVAKSTITILSGDTARKKILRIDGDPEDLRAKLDRLTG